jgi:hypothetical protein
MFVAVAIVGAAIMGAAFVRWRAALKGWRNAIASIPGHRRTTFEHFWRMVMFGGLVALVVWLLIQQ